MGFVLGWAGKLTRSTDGEKQAKPRSSTPESPCNGDRQQEKEAGEDNGHYAAGNVSPKVNFAEVRFGALHNAAGEKESIPYNVLRLSRGLMKERPCFKVPRMLAKAESSKES
jgi:hypothetical protein